MLAVSQKFPKPPTTMSSSEIERIKSKLVFSTSPLYSSKNLVHCVAWSCDGRKLALACQDNTVKINHITDLNTKSPVVLSKHTGEILSVNWSPVEKDRLATCSTDKSVCLWDLRASEKVPAVQIPTQGENINSCWHPNGSILAVGNKDDLLTFIDTRGGPNADGSYILHTYKSSTEVNEISWNYDESHFYMTTGSGKIKIFEYPEMEQVHQVEAHSANCYCLEFDPKGRFVRIIVVISARYFATGGVEAIVGLWELDDYTCIRTYSDMEEEIRGLSFSHDGELLAIGTASNIMIVHVDSGQTIHTINSVPDGISRLSWHPSKYYLAYSRSLHVCSKIKGNDKCLVCNGEAGRYNRNEATAGIFGLVI